MTKKQEKVLAYVKKYSGKNGYPPTIREVAKRFKLSPQGANVHLIAIAKYGKLLRIPKIARGILITAAVMEREFQPENSSGASFVTRKRPKLGPLAPRVNNYIVLVKSVAQHEKVYAYRVGVKTPAVASGKAIQVFMKKNKLKEVGYLQIKIFYLGRSMPYKVISIPDPDYGSELWKQKSGFR